jgi:hypothetical protein
MSESELVTLDGDTKLSELVASRADMVLEYWSPVEGDCERCVFLGIEEHNVQDFNTGKLKTIKCVALAFEVGETFRKMVNGSKRLVAAFEENNVVANSAFEIKYFGCEKNATNNNKSGRWSVVPLQRPMK